MTVIKGISHFTFSVSDLEASILFYQQVLDAALLLRDARTAYFDLAGLWLALNVQEGIPRHEAAQSYTHIAFTVDQAGLEAIKERLQELGIAAKPSRPRGAGEGSSLYFADPDGHLLEVHCGNLETRLSAYHQHEEG